MYCKNCGKEVNENAVACINCGVPPLAEKHFCHECGVETKENQVICIKCGISLEVQQKGKVAADTEGWYRSSDDKVIFGLFGGIGHKMEINPWILRIVALVIPGWPLYFLALLLPQRPTKNS